jgi:hypothetical protein
MSRFSRPKVGVTKWGDRGFAALLMNWQEDEDFEVSPVKRTPQEACQDAAARLRMLADRFDTLANTDDPWSIATQKRVNAGKAP